MPRFTVYEFDTSTCVIRDEGAEWAVCSAFEGQSESHARRAERICTLLNNHYRGVALDAIDGRSPQEWAVEMAYRIADEAGYDDDTRERLVMVLAASPELDQLVGSGVIEDSYFEAC
jgi:hypothetical protein